MDQETLDRLDSLTRDANLNPGDFKVLSEGFVEIMRTEIGVVSFDLSEEGLSLLDPIIENIRESLLSDSQNFILNVMRIGSFLGETFIKLYGGQWIFNQQFKRWGVEVGLKNYEKIFINVFHKIVKRIINGPEDSIDYYCKMNRDIIKNGFSDPKSKK